MAEYVVILEDDPARISIMRACLANILPGATALFFDTEQKTIPWLARHLGQVVLISLDHDLPLRQDAGRMVDCGTGRQVADYLASIAPTCPVIVHSSNTHSAPGMFLCLNEAGWPCARVNPCDDLTWIVTAWADTIRAYIRNGWIRTLERDRS